MFICKPIFKIFVAHFRTKGMLNHDKIIFVWGWFTAWWCEKPPSKRPRIQSSKNSLWDYGTYHIMRPTKALVSMRSLARAFSVGSNLAHMNYESRRRVWPKIIGHLAPTGWLRMHVWRISLRRMKRTKISWMQTGTDFLHISVITINESSHILLLYSYKY